MARPHPPKFFCGPATGICVGFRSKSAPVTFLRKIWNKTLYFDFLGEGMGYTSLKEPVRTEVNNPWVSNPWVSFT